MFKIMVIMLVFMLSATLSSTVISTVDAHPLIEKATEQGIGDKTQTKIKGLATYLANEGVMIASGEHKIVFDPFFHNDFGYYQLVPESICSALFNGTKPYDNVNAVFVSHAHEDHFSAADMLKFLKSHPAVHLYAPQQAVDQLMALSGRAKLNKEPNKELNKQLLSRITGIDISYGAKPFTSTFGQITIEAVRIPHAGGEGRRQIQNMAFRVSLANQVTVLHMGDADPKDKFFLPYDAFWKQRQTDVAFPPYWFFGSQQGKDILDKRINSKHAIGVHVAKEAIEQLKGSSFDVFTVPGEVYQIAH